MTLFIVKRCLLTLPIMLVISLITFFLVRLSPMDPARVVLQAQGVPQITDDLIQKTREELGMNEPFLIQFRDWLFSAIQLDFGNSYVTGRPVWDLLGPAFLHSLQLTLVSIICIIFVSISAGVICAVKERTITDLSIRGGAFFFISMPSYVTAALLVYLFSLKLGLFPTSGKSSLASYVLPVLVMVIGYAGIYFRIIRTSLITNLKQDYITFARVCGHKESRVIGYAIRNSVQVAVSIFGMAIPIILGSTVIIENIFAWPGLGTLSIRAIFSRDFPIIQAYVFVLGISFVLFNMLSDIVNAYLNPKQRNEM